MLPVGTQYSIHLILINSQGNEMEGSRTAHDSVKDYYGKLLQSTLDLKTNACKCDQSLYENYRKILDEIDREILDKFYGCGSPIPPALERATVLDLGCGTGRDVYIVSRLVGPDGFVIGVDMTDAQLDVARRH